MQIFSYVCIHIYDKFVLFVEQSVMTQLWRDDVNKNQSDATHSLRKWLNNFISAILKWLKRIRAFIFAFSFIK